MIAPPQSRRLATDARVLKAGTGVATYARGLARAQALLSGDAVVLAEGHGAGRTGRWLSAAWPGAHAVAQLSDGRLDGSELFRVAQVHFDVWRRPLVLRVAGPPGVMHWSYPLPMTIAGWRNVYTVHDVIPLLRPDLTPIDPHRHRRLLRAVAAAADAIVTVSGHARDAVAAALDLAPDRVIDCGQAVETPEGGGRLPSGVAPGAYLLAIGTVERRKNLERLVAAYRTTGLALPLVIAGPDGDCADAVARAAAVTPGVVRLPYLPTVAVQALIAQARALVMPSLAEGFGLPAVEAMAAGTPVLASRGTALEEVAGGAALLVDPLSGGDIAAGLRRIAGDEAERARLVRAGRARAAAFTVDRFAERLGSLYARLIASGPPGT